TADVSLSAENTSTSSAVANSVAQGDKVGVGAALALNKVPSKTYAQVQGNAGVTGARDFRLTATSNNAMTSSVQAGAAGGIAISPALALSLPKNETLAGLGVSST